MSTLRNLARRIVYSSDFRPWTPAEKKAFKALSGLNSLPTPLAVQYKKRKHYPQLFLAQLREELGRLVSTEWYQSSYLSLLPGIDPQDFYVQHGVELGHIPNEFIVLEEDLNKVSEGLWIPRSVAEFLLREDSESAYIGAAFNPGAYLDLYPDIKRGRLNPLLHYLTHGQNEGRLANYAELQTGNGSISYRQQFNPDTRESEWIIVRGTVSSLEISGIEIFHNEQKIGNARLGIPEIIINRGKQSESLGFQFSSELRVTEKAETLSVKSLSFEGERITLCEIPLLKEEKIIEQTFIDQYSPPNPLKLMQEGKESTIQLLVLTHHLGIGGGQLYLQEILRALSSVQDIGVTLISMVGGVLENELQDLGIDVHIFPGPMPFSRNAYEQYLWEFDELLSGKQFDLFIANTTGCFPQVDWCLRNNIDGLWAIHESYTRQGWARAAFGRNIDHYSFERLEYALLNTKVLVFEAQGTLDIVMSGLPTNNSKIVKYGIDIPEKILSWNKSEVTSSPENQRVLKLVSVGTFEERKAQGLMVLLAKHLCEIGKNVEFDLVGYKPGDYYSDSVHKAVIDLKLENIVRLHGITSEWQKFLDDADFFFMPSDVESMPQSMMIAMANGIPAIGSRVFGIPELITDGVTGYIHEPNDIFDMTRVICKALELSDQDYMKMRESARQFIITNHEKSAYVNYFVQSVLDSKREP